MIWMVWRQHRKQVLFALLGIALLAALLVPSGLEMHKSFDDNGLAACLATVDNMEWVQLDLPDDNGCAATVSQFANRFEGQVPLAMLLVFLPLLLGLFLGAPLVASEVEHGTHRLVWAQSVTRRHWAVIKFGFVCVSALALAAAYAALATWWITPLSQATGLGFDWLIFDQQGFVPLGYTLFAVSLGIFAGTVWHRVLPAMAVTLAGFIGLRIAVAAFARPRFLPPREHAYSVFGDRQPNPVDGNWVISQDVHDAAGRMLDARTTALCAPPPTASPSPGATPEPNFCLDQYGVGAYNLETYQPADRFWLFQSIETGLFAGLALLLLAFAIYRVRRRIT